MHTKPPDLARALAFAIACHGGQVRKGTEVPYVSHLLQVAGLVLEHGGDTEQAVAALLHDAVEDCEEVDLETVRAEFGDRVAGIVARCTDTFEGDTPEHKSPWKERKKRYLERLASAPDDSVLVSACDKLHNLGALVADVRASGIGYLDRFSAGAEEQLWYFGEILNAVGPRLPEKLRARFEELVAEFERLVSGGG
jgi:(p)ppGpp synthase/HD superfamily hydrolase